MKVGTDGILLGAWAQHNSPINILDIGAGSGLITLMLAQRFTAAKIIALEPDLAAFKQATENFEGSAFTKQLVCENTPLQEFATSTTFDLIVSNPPYHKEQVLAPEEQRAQARSENFLPAELIFQKASELLSNEGNLALIYPSERQQDLVGKAEKHSLYLQKVCFIFGHKKAPCKRVLLQFSKTKTTELLEENLILEEERHKRTEAYQKLTDSFYL